MRYLNNFFSVHHFTSEHAKTSQSAGLFEPIIWAKLDTRKPVLWDVLQNCAELTTRTLDANPYGYYERPVSTKTLRTVEHCTTYTNFHTQINRLFDRHAYEMFSWKENSHHETTYRNFFLENNPDYNIPRPNGANLEPRHPLVSVLYRKKHPTPDRDSWIVFFPTMPSSYFSVFPTSVESSHTTLEEYGVYFYERFKPPRFAPNDLFKTHEQYAFWHWLNIPDSLAKNHPYRKPLEGFHTLNIETIQTTPDHPPTEIKANRPKHAWHWLHPLFNQNLHNAPYESHPLISEPLDVDWLEALREKNYEDAGLWLVVADDLDEMNKHPELSKLIRFFCTTQENWR